MGIIDLRRADLACYDFEKLDGSVKDDLLNAASLQSEWFRSKLKSSLPGLEYFLQVYGQQLIPEKDFKRQNTNVLETFCVYEANDLIFRRNKRNRINFTRSLLKCLTSIDYFEPSSLYMSGSITDFELDDLLSEYGTPTFDKSLHDFWCGWPSESRSGTRRYYKLHDVYRSCGPQFTKTLFSAVDLFHQNQRRSIHGSLATLFSQLVILGRDNLFQLQSPEGSRRFFLSQLKAFLESAQKPDSELSISSLSKERRIQYRLFLYDYLFPTGLIVEPEGGLPTTRSYNKKGAQTNLVVGQNGKLMKQKLLTLMPEWIAGPEVASRLLGQIDQDVDAIARWARWKVDGIWSRFEKIETLARRGVVVPKKVPATKLFRKANGTKSWMTAIENPKWQRNVCSTFRHYGYVCRNDKGFDKLFTDPSAAAEVLAIPDILDLIAFNALLAIEHPQLTPSAIWSVDAYDESGRLICLKRTDEGCYLRVIKRRRGPENAEQLIKLTDCSQTLIEKLLALTEPLREYLRDRDDENWKALYLHRGHAMAFPRTVDKAEIAYRDQLQKRFKTQLSQLGIPDEDAVRLGSVFTFTRLRASVAIQTFVRTGSLREFANVLGHKEFKRSLIDHYMPSAIRAYIEERSLRVFQLEIVFEATKNSRHQLSALGFNSEHELDMFLSENVRPVFDNSNSALTSSPNGRKTIFCISDQTLKVLLMLEKIKDECLRGVSPRLSFWQETAVQLLAYIRAEDFERPDVRALLTIAESDLVGPLFKRNEHNALK